LSALVRITAFGYPFGIFKDFLMTDSKQIFTLPH